MDGVSVLSQTEDTVTIRLERMEGPDMLVKIGKQHYFHYEPSEDENEYLDERAVTAAVLEADDYVFSGYGELLGYDDEGCDGAFDIEVHEAPGDKKKRKQLVDRLVKAMKARVKGVAQAPPGRTLREKFGKDPFTGKSESYFVDEEGLRVSKARPNDVIVKASGTDEPIGIDEETWGVYPFENEAAAWWIKDLKGSDAVRLDKITFVFRYIEEEFNSKLGVGIETAQCVIAASEILARIQGRPDPASAPAALAKWLATSKLEATPELLEKASKAIDCALGKNSGLRVAWTESGHLDAWLAVVADLRGRLGS
ncbi:MAG: DUF4259 domain-containing protein [Sandaracinaceae bacterium]|nr:DUF4259 domain-containing protein [Sandaracinaceae bacterium]MBK8590261.1 DUF4259 domain-containing protein [Sandaracinaceae bacterium]